MCRGSCVLLSPRLLYSTKPRRGTAGSLALSRNCIKGSYNAARQSSAAVLANSSDASRWPHPVFSSAHIAHHKSGFQAHATAFRLGPPGDDGDKGTECSASRLEALFAHLAELVPRTKRATHRMYAWRARLPSSRSQSTPNAPHLHTGSSDGGESGAGVRLDRLLALSGCEDVVVVVYRWYGGVQLGSERWKCISGVAKEALRAGGFIRGEVKGEEKSQRTASVKGGKGRKR